MFIAAVALKAQTITGKIVDSNQQPIDGATIVLQTMDSVYIGASISNTDGVFLLNHHPEQYRSIVQHLIYKTRFAAYVDEKAWN